MAKEDPEVPYVDYTSVRFPSDRLTVGRLRELYPELFDPQGPPGLAEDEMTAAFKAELRSRGVPPLQETDTFFELLRPLPDGQTIADVRRDYPDRFDVEGGPDGFKALYEGTSGVLDMLWNERVLARMAYQTSLGRPDDLPVGVAPGDRPGFSRDLVESYVHYGLARSEHEAGALIADFTARAAAQASPPRDRGGEFGR